ncbi:MAG: lysylphosphatidylglycerol synthase domain-containing protein [Olleya sp.]
MYSNLPYKTKQFFFVLIKLSIVVGAFYFIYQKLLNNDTLDFDYFISFLTENELFSTKNIISLLVLTIFNWFFEIIKWRFLVSKLKRLSVLEATQQSLGALTASLFTPNRIGEYGAKVIYYSKPQQKRILLLNLISNMMQMSITVILGVIGFILFYKNYDITIDYFKLSRGLIIVFVVAMFAFFGMRQNKYQIKGFPIEKIRDFVSNLGATYLVIGLFLSLLRYSIFSFQFYFILTLFGVELSYFEAMIIITSMYLFTSIIPTISIFDVVIKGSVAVYLFGFATINELTILSVILLMWLLNFALPSVFGSYYVLNFNLSKTEH